MPSKYAALTVVVLVLSECMTLVVILFEMRWLVIDVRKLLLVASYLFLYYFAFDNPLGDVVRMYVCMSAV